jgi:hypothetical protein
MTEVRQSRNVDTLRSDRDAKWITSALLGDHLRQEQEMLSQKMVDAIRGRLNGKQGSPRIWPLSPARHILMDVLRAGEDKAEDDDGRTDAMAA